MGCQESKEATPEQRRARAGIGHTERLASSRNRKGVGQTERMMSNRSGSSTKASKARQMSMYGGKKLKTKVDLEDPKLDGVGHLMPEEVVKRRRSSVRYSHTVLGREDRKVAVDYAHLTQRGYYPDDVHKANQDDLSVTHKFAGEDGDSLFVVYDGHGTYGDSCARFAKKKLPQLIAKYVRQKRAQLYRSELEATGQSTKGAFNPQMWPKLTKQQYEGACRKAHVECNQLMHDDESVKDVLSGTTAVSACFHFGRLTACNVGDSRIVLGHRFPSDESFGEEKKAEEEKEEEKDPNETELPSKKFSNAGKLLAIPLSRDQTPYRKDERERVKRAGACVMSIDQMEGDEPMHEDWGDMVLGEDIDVQGDPPRVWVQGKDYPGCAFTRSIGDSMADDLGVYAVPEMLTTELTENDEILVIASDGVFEFLTNQTVIDICSECENPMEACQKLVEASYEQWLHYEDRTDDITAIVCFLRCDTPPSQDADGAGTTDDLLDLAIGPSHIKPKPQKPRKKNSGGSIRREKGTD